MLILGQLILHRCILKHLEKDTASGLHHPEYYKTLAVSDGQYTICIFHL